LAFTARQNEVVVALGDTLFPSIADDDPSGGEILPGAFADFLPTLSPQKIKALGTVLVLFDGAAALRYGRRFCKLPPRLRAKYVEGWMRSRLAVRRIIYRSLRETFALLYYQDRRMWPSIGYDGPLVDRTEQ
jgi:hypothetical protein